MINIQKVRFVLFGCVLAMLAWLLTQCSNQNIIQSPREKLVVRFAIPPKLEPEPQPELPKKQLSDEEIIQCYWRWYGLLGIKLPTGEDKYQLEVGSIKYDEDSRTFRRSVWGMPKDGKSSRIEMVFDATTGALYGLFNYAVWIKLYKLPAGVQPTKTKEEIMEAASKYQRLIIGELANNFRISLKYSQWESRGGGTNLKGYWDISWSRIMNSYETLGDVCNMSIHEKYGLITFAFSMRSLPCPTDIKITEDQAKKIASATVPIVIPKLPHLPQQFKIKKITECNLYIINPTYIFSPGVESIWTYIGNRHTRLAYRIAFWMEGEGKNQDFKIVIEVDAATGEILGGDYPK